ncbi:MAG: hypothetical protein DWQ02_13375 [Bacteroidetes bacterium]|nr:MAG: hypothetical protein DWQ02_13375 [Bacteroidota bacterium]
MNPDKRFVGRGEMKKKLENLITKSQTNSGTYLVTGFRGMGKTSLVNKVLSDLLNQQNALYVLKVVFSYLVVVWLSSFFTIQAVFVFSLLGVLAFIYMLSKKSEVSQKRRLKTQVLDILKIFVNPFENELENSAKRVFATGFSRIGIVLIFSSLALFLINYQKFVAKYSGKIEGQIISYSEKIKVFIIALGAYFFIVIIIELFNFFRYHRKNNNESNPLNQNSNKRARGYFFVMFFFLMTILSFVIIVKNGSPIPSWIYTPSIIIFLIILLILIFGNHSKKIFHSFVNNSNIIPVYINLGKENLSEEDILKLVTYGLYNSYKRIALPFSYIKRGLWSLGVGIMVYLIGSTFYFFEPTYKLFNDWRMRSNLVYYFPSQTHFLKGVNLSDELAINVIDTLDDTRFPDSTFLENYYTIVVQNKMEIGQGFSIQDNFLAFTVTLDYFLLSIYVNTIRPFIRAGLIKNDSINTGPLYILSNTLGLHPNFRFIPRYDFLFLMYILFFSYFSRWLLRSRVWGVSHRAILKKLKNLVDSLEAEIDIGKGRNMAINYPEKLFSLGFTSNKKKSYPIKSAPEIEITLIEILREIESIPKLRMRPRFVFIFDELDKIQPRELNDKDNNNNPKDYSESEWTKKRQDTIGTILANLKHFFNSAKAKFIFIAGREMYDAALADISDRDALIGSLFHEVIYVHSFYKDPADERLSDITSMTERYICQFLIPEEELDDDPNLSKYNSYLLKNVNKLFEKEQNKELAIAKIIMSLHNFISYVSYRSNGAPKKITKIFEEYIKGYPDKKTDFASTIITRRDENSLYLHFSFNDQYIFSVGRYLFNPFVIAVNKYIKAFEDKLLVSTSFLLNHIYKFHKVGFSHKTLELTPEIIAIYKAPELRDFINRLITFLSQTHLRKILSGLYDFKFYSRIEKEIAYISKISESESAAFNFTLDESLIIKSIFRNKLNKVRKYWGSEIETKVHVESVAFINNNLGDLSFNDAKYFEAIHYYKEALVKIDNTQIKELSPDLFIFLIRTELKLGLAYEMIKNADEALMIYDDISRKAIDYIRQRHIKYNKESWTKDLKKTELITILRLFYQPLLAKMQLIEKSTIKSLTKTQLRENLVSFKHIINDYLSPEQNFLLRAEYYDKIGDLLFYKNGIPFGKFEKGEEAGETDPRFFKDIQEGRLNHEYFYSLPVGAYYRYMVSLTSLIHVGISQQLDENVKINYFDITKPHESDWLIIHYFTSFLFNRIGKTFPISRKSFFLAAGNSLSDAGNTILSIISAEINTNPVELNLLDVKKLKRVLSFKMKGEGGEEALTFAGENQIATLKVETENEQEGVLHLREKVNKFYGKFDLCRLHTALRYIYIAAIYFERAGDYKGFVFQLSKILHVLRLIVLKVVQNEGGAEQVQAQAFLDFLNEYVVYKAIRYNYKAYKNYDHSEAQQLKNSLGFVNYEGNQKMELEKVIKASTSAAEDIKEILLIYADIKLKLFPEEYLELEDGLINPYTNVSLRGNRLSELNYKSHFNYKYLKKLTSGIKPNSNREKRSESIIALKPIINRYEAKEIIDRILDGFSNGRFKDLEKLEFIILDSIFILYEMRLTIEIFGQSYIHNHSWYASIYRRLGFWSMLFHEYVAGVKSRENKDSKEEKDNRNKPIIPKVFPKGRSQVVEELLKKLIGQEEFTDLDSISFYEKALKHCYSIYETHSEGQAYQDFIQEMNYLDDDFNDNLYHFSATLERMRINFDMVKNHIDDLSEVIKLNKKRFYFESFFTHLEKTVIN